MKNEFQISYELNLPKDTVTQTLVVYGAKGMGKTNLIAVLCEELADNKQKFSYLDPIGAGYGLRYAADGKGKGLDIVVLGGKHGDIPIEPTAGAIVADFVVNERVNVVIDISRRADGRVWKKSEKIRFCADYFERLFERQGEKCHPMMQLVDEAARFIPQLIPHGSIDLPRCVGAIEQVVEEGRNFGIGIALITQRSARMNKSVSELAECMIAFRTVGPNSISAITDWLGEHVPKARHNEFVEKLRGLPRGQAMVVSPGWLNFEGVVPIRMRETFDSSATPTADRKLITTKPLEKAKLDEYKTQMAETIEKAKAEDPKELKKQLAAEKQRGNELAKQLEKANKAAPKQEIKSAKILKVEPAIPDKTAKRLETAATRLREAVSILVEANTEILPLIEKALKQRALPSLESVSRPAIKIHLPPERIMRTSTIRGPASEPPPHDNGDKPIGKGAREILIAAAQNPEGVTDEQIAILTGYKKTSRTTYKQQLKANGFLTDGGRGYQATEIGLEWLGNDFQPLPIGDELRDHWMRKLPQGELALFKVYVENHPNEVSLDDMMQATGYQKTSVTTYRQKLSARNLINGHRASDNLFQ